MSDSIQFRVRFDPSPKILDPRALTVYRDHHDDILRRVASQMCIPREIAGVDDSNYSSAVWDARILRELRSSHREFQLAVRHFCERYWRLRKQHGHRLFSEQVELYFRYHLSLPVGLKNRRQRKLRTYLIIQFCDRYHQRLARYYK